MKSPRRDFLRASAATVGAATVLPAAFGHSLLSGPGPDGSQPSPSLSAATDRTGKPVPVRIHIAADAPVRTMRGGTGASFHAMSKELPRKGNGESWAGSGWGGYPEDTDVKHWEELFKHAEWLGMNWCRVEIEQSIYEPERRVFDWDSPDMRVLYRILDWAERRGVEVFLQQMWANVAWNALPGNAKDPIRRLRSLPHSMEEWANGLGELVSHLMRTKGYTCIRWVSVSNEPGQDFSWWQDAEMKPVPITAGLRAAREEFVRRGLAVPISGPDWTDLPELNPAEVDFDTSIGAYDLHSYFCTFDSMTAFGYSLADAEQRMVKWANWAHAKNKPMFLSEFGTMAFGWGSDDTGPACYQSGLKNASLVVRGINAGVDAFNRWSFVNRGDLDGHWQLLRTWDIDNNKLLDVFTPEPNAYLQFAMLSRFLPLHSGVLLTRVEAPYLQKDRKLVATALRTPKGNITLLVVNESHRSADVNIELSGLKAPIRLQRYSVTREAEDKVSADLRAERSMDVSKTLTDRIAPMSIVVYSTYNLNPQDPGVIAE